VNEMSTQESRAIKVYGVPYQWLTLKQRSFIDESTRLEATPTEFHDAQANRYTYQFARPSVTVDCVVFSGAYVALIRRGKEPFKGCWALPGGFLEMNERIEDAAIRELFEETSLVVSKVFPVGVFDEPRRDPRDRVIGHAFWTIIPLGSGANLKAGDDAAEAEWIPVSKIVAGDYVLAFDHVEIVKRAVALKDAMIFGETK
jgi:8-oxo-dGTP diphosphatase